MKKLLCLLFGFACFYIVYADEQPLRICAMEDFRRFAPGVYHCGTAPFDYNRRIEERDGKHILCVDYPAEVMIGWRFNDIRKNNYILRIRFRFLEDNKYLNFTFHGHGGDPNAYNYFQYRFRLFPQKAFLLIDLRAEEKKLNGTRQNPVEHVPNKEIKPRLKINEWYEAEFRVCETNFEAYVIHPDGKRTPVLISPILPGARLQPSIFFGGPAEVEWVKSYLLPE